VHWQSLCLIAVFLWSTLAIDPFQQYTIVNSNGLEVKVIPFGATLTHFFVPDEKGIKRDVILGFDDPLLYRDHPIHPYFGAIVGRYANRIANGTFTLDSFVYHAPLNERGVTTLHGGDVGYDRRTWNVVAVEINFITLNLLDGDLVEAFPGQANVTITYELTENNELTISFHATTDSTTIINLSSHIYWNLNGFADNTQTMLDHIMYIGASRYTPVDSNLIPTGAIDSVKSAPWLDFTTAKAIGANIANGTVTPTGGYDNNFVFDKPSLTDPVVTVYAPITGIALEMRTDQPGLQFYSSNSLDGTIPRKKDQIYGGDAQGYQKYSGFVIEPQHFPDSIHHPEWPTTVIKKGETYQHTAIFTVGTPGRKVFK